MDTIGPVWFFHEEAYPALNPNAGRYWMSGESIHGRALALISLLAKETKAPLIGVGGVMDAQGVRRMVACGASAVGFCSAVIIHGLDHVAGILNDLKAADPMTPNLDEWKGEAHIALDRSLCIGCGECVKHCGYLALRMCREGVSTDDGACRRCGLCVQHCPTGAISLHIR
jgi:NAD-dependent dihydropyrimidine dehydrogenase PreA subunit